VVGNDVVPSLFLGLKRQDMHRPNGTGDNNRVVAYALDWLCGGGRAPRLLFVLEDRGAVDSQGYGDLSAPRFSLKTVVFLASIK
jgi:hypothetical protein